MTNTAATSASQQPRHARIVIALTVTLLGSPVILRAADGTAIAAPPATRPSDELRAISDAFVIPSDEELRDDLRTTAVQRRADSRLKVFCNGDAAPDQPAHAPPAIDVANDPLAALDDAIAKLEKQIADLPAADTQLRPIYRRSLDGMRKARERVKKQSVGQPKAPRSDAAR